MLQWEGQGRREVAHAETGTVTEDSYGRSTHRKIEVLR